MRRLAITLLLLCRVPTAHAADLDSPDPDVRARAARLAGDEQRHGAAPALRRLLRDESWKVREAAARALGLLRHRPARRELMVLAQTDFSARVRRAAAEAVKRMDPLGYASVLATSDQPPVRRPPAPKNRPGPAAAAHRAVLLGLGLGANALRAEHSLAGQAAAGLRWPHAELQLTLSFPALGLAGQVRWNILPRCRLVPYLTVGAAVAYNNTEPELSSAAAAFVGGGLRLARLWRRFYVHAEVLASWVISQGRRAGPTVKPRSFALPVLLGAGVELWP